MGITYICKGCNRVLGKIDEIPNLRTYLDISDYRSSLHIHFLDTCDNVEKINELYLCAYCGKILNTIPSYSDIKITPSKNYYKKFFKRLMKSV